MWPVVWLDGAIVDLSEIITYIAQEDPNAARRRKARIESSVLPLAEHPYLSPSGRAPGTWELVVHPNYMIVYRVTTARVEIVSVVHTRRESPPTR